MGRSRVLRSGGWALLGVLLVAMVATGFAFVQGRRTPAGEPVYVALGSSYAAGAGLGALQKDGPLLCARSVGGYPPRLAKLLGVSLVDMSCGGATTVHLLDGGQFLQGPQIRVIDRRTRLVTITVGGNDIGLIGDLSLLAMRGSGGMGAWLTGAMHAGQDHPRDFARLHRQLVAVIRAVRTRSPDARVVVATYPRILPPSGTCPRLHLDAAAVARMRPVEQRLATTTREAAAETGAVLVDMNALGADHHACSAVPWIRGWARLLDAPFHPTAAGATATAHAIAAKLARLPAGVPAVGQHDAAGHQAGGVRRQEMYH